MSLFNDLQNELIEKPRNTGNYRKILKEEGETEKTRKEERQEMRAKLSEKEYMTRLQSVYYQRKKKDIKKKYDEKREKDMELVEELLKEIDEETPEPINYDKYYTKKFRNDDTTSRAYNFARRSSKLMRISWMMTPKMKSPFRISNRHSMCQAIDRLFEAQIEAYKYLKPHLEEMRWCKYAFAKKQYIYSPLYYIEEPMRTIIENAPVPNHRAMYVADGMLRWKFMVSELYLWRDSFIFGDVLVTQTWNLFRIALENNLPWLTKDTVEDIHKLRVDWHKNKWEVAPPIYIVNDAYLIKVQPNERETLYYIVPT